MCSVKLASAFILRNEMNRILVASATGFLGRAVVTAFVEDGNLVRTAARSEPDPPVSDG